MGKVKGKEEKGKEDGEGNREVGGVGKDSALGVCFALGENTFSTYMKSHDSILKI